MMCVTAGVVTNRAVSIAVPIVVALLLLAFLLIIAAILYYQLRRVGV